MQRGQHEMARQGRLYRDRRGFMITNLTDHHDIGILSK